MTVLCRAIAALLLTILALLPIVEDVRAGSASPVSVKGDNRATSQVEAFKYVADIENVWNAEFGTENGSGDWSYSHKPLFDAAHEEQIGWADGYCIATAPGEWSYCTQSLYADTWTLSAHGVMSITASSFSFAIAGGTGDYEGIHGILHVSANEDFSQYFYRVEEQELTTYEPLSIAVSNLNWKTTYWHDPSYTYGNVLYWHEPTFTDVTESEQYGLSNGYCIATGPNSASECSWTIWGDDWSLSASGTKFDNEQSWLSIVGGSGAYAGATGSVSWETSEDGSQQYFDYYFDFLPSTLEKPIQLYIQSVGFLYNDLPEIGDTAGDVYQWHSPIWNAAQERKLGWSDGFCVLMAPAEWSACTLTLYTEHWTLTASGPVYETGDASTIAVTGGTGAYADAQGHILFTPEDQFAWYHVELEITVAPYSYWGAVSWDQVTEEEIPYWYTLGWNEYNWDGSHPAAVPDSESRTWEELTTVEQEAATAVGYDESTWNPSAVGVPEGDPTEYWSGYAWDELYLSERRLWGILGWDDDNWPTVPEAEMPASNWRLWAELKPAEQGAATTLGYDEESWNVYSVRTPEGDIELFWSQFAWEELHQGERQLFALLGWTAEAWTGELPLPETKYRTWAELSHVEKGAAIQLGYDQASWDITVLTR